MWSGETVLVQLVLQKSWAQQLSQIGIDLFVDGHWNGEGESVKTNTENLKRRFSSIIDAIVSQIVFTFWFPNIWKMND